MGPVAIRAATHVCAVIPNLLVQEFPGSRPGHAWTQELIDPPAEVRDRELVVPEGPDHWEHVRKIVEREV